MSWSFVSRWGCGMAVALSGIAPASAMGQAGPKPFATAHPNAPRAVTISWELQPGIAELMGFIVERLHPPEAFELREHRREHMDSFLEPSTTYWYRVCAVYLVDSKPARSCSDSLAVKTLPPAPATPGSEPPIVRVASRARGEARVEWSGHTRYDYFQLRFGPVSQHRDRDAGRDQLGPAGTGGGYTLTGLNPGERYRVQVQGCRRPGVTSPFNSQCSGFTDPIEFLAFLPVPEPPVVTVDRQRTGVRAIALQWTLHGDGISGVRIARDGRPLGGSGTSSQLLDRTVRPNTDYTYQVCVANAAGESCSSMLKASGTPTPPSAPIGVTVTRMRTGGGGTLAGSAHDAAQITDPITVLRWSHAPSESYIPGRFVTIERLDRIRAGDQRGEIRESWRELSRRPGTADPTSDNVPLRRDVGVQPGTSYRVCAVVPELGPSGKVCSVPAPGR
jgi:hypothetical protein